MNQELRIMQEKVFSLSHDSVFHIQRSAYSQRLRLNHVYSPKAMPPTMIASIQKSKGRPIIGRDTVLIWKRESTVVAGRAMKARTVNVFIISVCFVERSALFVSRSSVRNSTLLLTECSTRV